MTVGSSLGALSGKRGPREHSLAHPSHRGRHRSSRRGSGAGAVERAGRGARPAPRPQRAGRGRQVPVWRMVLGLVSDRMTIVLLVAAVVSALVSREWKTPVVILLVAGFNTVLNYVQQARAESSPAALRKMSVITARVRRDGHAVEIDRLARLLTLIAVVVVGVVVVLGLIRGQPWTELMLTAVSLAVATMPEGLPAVVAFTLARGAHRLARRGVIIKQLSAVETLGSTTHIATDRTGTPTLDEMTVRRPVLDGSAFRVTGEGVLHGGAHHRSRRCPARPPPDVYLAVALCSNATVRDGRTMGDPTEGALVVLAGKGGKDVEGARQDHPRVSEVPFDSDYRFHATFHEQTTAFGTSTTAGYRMFVKGAPGVLQDRADSVLTAEGRRPLTAQDSTRILAVGSASPGARRQGAAPAGRSPHRRARRCAAAALRCAPGGRGSGGGGDRSRCPGRRRRGPAGGRPRRGSRCRRCGRRGGRP
ncbi:hypothetical protein [Kocuria arenosa]|uniref:P-type ATPase n=1 Tax=Kocuria arenosa TaxID=3071446 RepID=UPI0034DA2B12